MQRLSASTISEGNHDFYDSAIQSARNYGHNHVDGGNPGNYEHLPTRHLSMANPPVVVSFGFPRMLSIPLSPERVHNEVPLDQDE